MNTDYSSASSLSDSHLMEHTPPPPPTTPYRFLHHVDQLLREPEAVLKKLEDSQDKASIARSMIFTIAIGASIFGAAIGTHRGGIQILYSAFKLPLVVLLTAALCAPTLTALNHALGRRTSLSRDIALILSSLALGSLIIAALAPLVLLAQRYGASYHEMILLVVGSCSLAGFIALRFFLVSLGRLEGKGRLILISSLMAVVMLVGAQLAWTMRPYLVRPKTKSIPIVRSLEGSFVDSVLTTINSAQGIYDISRRIPEDSGKRGGVGE